MFSLFLPSGDTWSDIATTVMEELVSGVILFAVVASNTEDCVPLVNLYRRDQDHVSRVAIGNTNNCAYFLLMHVYLLSLLLLLIIILFIFSFFFSVCSPQWKAGWVGSCSLDLCTAIQLRIRKAKLNSILQSRSFQHETVSRNIPSLIWKYLTIVLHTSLMYLSIILSTLQPPAFTHV